MSQLLAQDEPRRVHSGLHGGDREPQRDRDLPIRELLDIVENDHASVLVGQAADALLQGQPDFCRDDWVAVPPGPVLHRLRATPVGVEDREQRLQRDLRAGTGLAETVVIIGCDLPRLVKPARGARYSFAEAYCSATGIGRSTTDPAMRAERPKTPRRAAAFRLSAAGGGDGIAALECKVIRGSGRPGAARIERLWNFAESQWLLSPSYGYDGHADRRIKESWPMKSSRVRFDAVSHHWLIALGRTVVMSQPTSSSLVFPCDGREPAHGQLTGQHHLTSREGQR